MGKIQYSLILTLGFGLISQTVQQFDDDHFPHPDTRTGPKRQLENGNFPDSNHFWPNNGDYFPTETQAGLKQFDTNHVPSRALRHTQDYDNLPQFDEVKDNTVITNIPPIEHQANNHGQANNQVDHQIGNENFPSPDEIKGAFQTHTLPRENRQVDDDLNGTPITTITPINHGKEGHLQFPHQDTRTGPKRQLDNGDFPDSGDVLPEIDDAQKSKILQTTILPIDHQFVDQPNYQPGNPVDNQPGNQIDGINFPDPDDRLPNGDVNDGRTFTNLPPYIVPQFVKKHGNEDVRVGKQVESALCELGENRANNCHDKCSIMRGSEPGTCYCSGSCDSSNLLVTCRCENPNCECRY